MDTEQAFITSLYHRVTNDEDLKETMGGKVRLKLNQANKDEEFPFLVHRLSSIPENDPVVRVGSYYLDIWDYSSVAKTIYDARSNIVRLLDYAHIGLLDPSNSFMSVTQPAAGEPRPILIAARLFLTYNGSVPTDEERVQRYSMEFELRFTRSIQEIESLIS